MPAPKPPSPDEILAAQKSSVFVPQRVLEVDAVHMASAFSDSVPEDVLEGILVETATGKDGWSLAVRRNYRLEMVPGVRVLVEPGHSLEDVLAQLDRVRAELVANPRLLDPDWSGPLVQRPALRALKSKP